MNLFFPCAAVKTQFLLQKCYRFFPCHYALSSKEKTRSLVSSPGTDYIVPISIVPPSWDHLKADCSFPRSVVPAVLKIRVLDVKNRPTQAKDAASAHLMKRSKHLQRVKGGKRVQVATLLWSSTLDVTIWLVGARLTFAIYVLHFGRLVTVSSGTKPD